MGIRAGSRNLVSAWHDRGVSFVLLLLVLAVIAGITLVAAGAGGSLGAAEPERGPRGALPDGDVDRSVVDRLRFTLAFRGYRMDEVDGVLDRLGRELENRDFRIAELEGRPGAVEGDRVASSGPESGGTTSDTRAGTGTGTGSDTGGGAGTGARIDGQG